MSRIEEIENAASLPRLRFDLQELAGALGDLGVMAPLAVALITLNHLNATAVLAMAGLLYMASGLYFRLPVPVQPLKATAAIALATGAGAPSLAAAALIMGVLLAVLAATDLASRLSRLFETPVVRGIQLSLGITLMTGGWQRIIDARPFAAGEERLVSLAGFALPGGVLLAAVAAVILFGTKRKGFPPPALAVLAFGILAGLLLSGQDLWRGLAAGPDLSFAGFPSLADFRFALLVLVLPQIPLTFGNSVVATSDVAKRYFGAAAGRVTPRALCASLGAANLLAGAIGAMPLCHGSGGMTAHYRFGARTGGAMVIIGALFLTLAVTLGSASVAVFQLIPVAVLGFLLLYIGIEHALLIRDLWPRIPDLLLAGAVATASVVTGSLIWGLALGLVVSGARALAVRTLFFRRLD